MGQKTSTANAASGAREPVSKRELERQREIERQQQEQEERRNVARAEVGRLKLLLERNRVIADNVRSDQRAFIPFVRGIDSLRRFVFPLSVASGLLLVIPALEMLPTFVKIDVYVIAGFLGYWFYLAIKYPNPSHYTEARQAKLTYWGIAAIGHLFAIFLYSPVTVLLGLGTLAILGTVHTRQLAASIRSTAWYSDEYTSTRAPQTFWAKFFASFKEAFRRSYGLQPVIHAAPVNTPQQRTATASPTTTAAPSATATPSAATSSSVDTRRSLDSKYSDIRKMLAGGKGVPAEATEGAPTCNICLSNRPDVAFIPCGHVRCCVVCVRGLCDSSTSGSASYKCPDCRAPIEQVFYPARGS